MENNEQKLLNQIQELVNNNEFDTQRKIDIFLDIMGADYSPRVTLRISNMIDYCLKRKNDNLQISFDEYIKSLH